MKLATQPKYSTSGKRTTPLKKCTSGIFSGTSSSTTVSWQTTQCLRWENSPTTTTSALGVHYYGYRYYSTDLGRWINRDPIGENGGFNLYVVVVNNSVNSWDILGLKEKEIKGKEIKKHLHLKRNGSYDNKLILSLWPIDKTGSFPYTVSQIGYKYSMKADVSYLTCTKCIKITKETLEKERIVNANPILIVYGTPTDLPGLPTPSKIIDLVKSLTGQIIGGKITPSLTGKLSFLQALLGYDPDGLGILTKIANEAPKSLDDMNWVDLKFVPCVEKK